MASGKAPVRAPAALWDTHAVTLSPDVVLEKGMVRVRRHAADQIQVNSLVM